MNFAVIKHSIVKNNSGGVFPLQNSELKTQLIIQEILTSSFLELSQCL